HGEHVRRRRLVDFLLQFARHPVQLADACAKLFFILLQRCSLRLFRTLFRRVRFCRILLYRRGRREWEGRPSRLRNSRVIRCNKATRRRGQCHQEISPGFFHCPSSSAPRCSHPFCHLFPPCIQAIRVALS